MPHNGAHTHNGGGPAPLRERVNFPANKPVFITLEFDPPTDAVDGRYGDQYMYFLADDRITWFDPPVHQQIVRSGARAGDELRITKAKEGRDAAEWIVERVEQEPAPAVPQQQPPAQAAKHAPAPRPAQPQANAVQPGPAGAGAMIQAHRAAIDVAAAAEQYAAGKGLAIRYAAEDVRAIAATLYIQSRRSE